MRRRGIGRGPQPSLIGTAARTAVVVKTANAVSSSSDQKRQAQAAQSAQAQAQSDAQLQATVQAATEQALAANAAAAPAPAAPTMVEQLKELAELKAQGILSDAEFEAAKAQLINA